MPLFINHLLFLHLFIWSAYTIAETQYPITFDGRIPQNATKSLFKSVQSPFNPRYVLGQSAETALRRTELLVNNKPLTVSGKKTWFTSLRTSSSNPLNYNHEHLLVFHEAQDFQADFYSLKTGKPMEDIGPWKEEGKSKTFFLTPFTEDIWHNFGIYLNYDDNEMQVLYSTADNPLRVATPMLPNNLSGKAPTTLGETHFGLQKRPTGANLTNYLYEGTQEFGIHEGLIMGGIWQVSGQAQNCSLQH
ncbi:glycoside hydrolase family 131 protein [Zopfia rhizophila CBS 207.26]|uniref:Glycoside hydrolase family 131 protein n=1 Tax=Zopfia rhizophila CBS 207.26 TaxID=1314779 RepID=A0A6A6DDZ9_9PEZI|nr:glycoside hydrolase family 131 protein [Zopfia rhizophila CBS 207.26]